MTYPYVEMAFQGLPDYLVIISECVDKLADRPEIRVPLLHQLKSLVDDLISTAEFLFKLDEQFQALLRLSNHMQDLIFKDEVNPEQLRTMLNMLDGEYMKYNKFEATKLNQLNEEEILRLNEAWHTIQEKCYWASIVSSACAFESRLRAILEHRNLSEVKRIRDYPRVTLGALSRAYRLHKEAFDNCIPEEYEGVFLTINKHRVVSAHPKDIEVIRRDAETLFNHTLSFLLDERCQRPN